MVGLVANSTAVLRGLIVTIVLLIVAIVLANLLGSGLAFLGLVLWLEILGAIALGVWLILRAKQLYSGAGAIVIAASIGTAFFVPSQPIGWLLWTVLFFIGVGLIVWGTRADTVRPGAWVLLLPRVTVGWALVDNAQDHFWNNWLPGGGGFLQIATQASSRQPLWFLDPLYQGFLRGVVVPGADIWAALTICGELSFGLLLAIGLFGPIGALGAMWLNGNYMLMKGFIAHGAYTDKTFFAVELFCLLTLASLAFGLDASLRQHLPSWLPKWLAEALMGTPGEQPEAVGRAASEPA